MGSDNSKQSSSSNPPTNTGTTESATNNETSSPSGTVAVILHVYKPDPNSPQGSMPGVYHSGVEVYGSEYYFAGGASSGTGVYVQRPKTQPRGSQWVYDTSIEIDKIDKTKNEVRDIINELRQEFQASSYNLTSNNCNHFSDALCVALCGKHIPPWVNRLASIGSAMGGGKLANDMSREQKHQQLAQTNAEYAASTYTGPPKPIQEFVPEIKTDFLLNSIDLNKCSTLNVQNDNDDKYITCLFTQEIGEKCKKQPIPITSDSDEQILLFIPFKKPVALVSIGLALPYSKSCPKTIKLFVNKPNMDFDDASNTTATETIEIGKIPPKNNSTLSYWMQSFPLKTTRFTNVNYLTVFIEDNFEEEVSQVYKMEFWGRTG